MMTRLILALLSAFLFCSPQVSYGWSEHPMIVYPILRDMPEMAEMGTVQVKSLQRFLMEEEEGLARLLAEQEAHARKHISNYVARPEALAFVATGDTTNIVRRFIDAVRINPNVTLALYLHLLPGEDTQGRTVLDPYSLTPMTRLYEMLHTTYVGIGEGEEVDAISVLATATDEPDYGFDIGLFEDNHTAWGSIYGFGKQPFGNPELEYGSQAPFHMGFYHESRIVFAAAPFLKRTFVEYRIHLYRTLAEYAFSSGQNYWGFRFLGWATHYLNDMSMPYHTSVLPAKGTPGMLWINIKAMLGFPRSFNNAVILLSNRHIVYELFQWKVLRAAHVQGDKNHPFLTALNNPVELIPYNDGFARDIAARESYRLARRSDRLLRRNIPAYLVSDPKHEITGSSELDNLLDIVMDAKGEQAMVEMTRMIAERFQAMSMHTRSFIISVLPTIRNDHDI